MMKFAIKAIALLFALISTTALAQNYPARTIRMVIPFAAGGNTDIIGRIFAPKMAEILGQQIIIDNRGGAGGAIGTEIVMRAPPDGYTLLMASAGHTINPSMIKKLPYDSVRDFTPMGIVADVPTAFVLHPSLPPKNLKEFVALAKVRPNDIFYSTAGIGTVDVRGYDVAVDWQVDDKWLVAATYSNQGKIVFPEIGGTLNPLMSNSPKHRASGTIRYTNESNGLGWEFGTRYSDAFPVNSGLLNSLGTPPNPTGTMLYPAVRVQTLFDASASWRLPIQPKVARSISRSVLFSSTLMA